VEVKGDKSAPFNYITFKVNNVQGDWVYNFDTKIPISNYTLIVVGSSLEPVNGSDMNYILPLGYKGATTTTDLANRILQQGTTPASQVYAFKDGSTWRLYADYKGGSLANGNGNWIINCIAVNNTLVKQYENQIIDLGGNASGGLTTNPLQ